MQIIDYYDDQYPKLLKQIKNPPKKLYVKGDATLLNKDLFAIIGSRNYSEYGEMQAQKFSKKLSKAGIGIVSGMALGIDSFAHMETIKNGGKTIAVLGSGFNYIYPKENRELFNMIIKSGGAVISEYPPNTQMQKRYFPQRNRIVSGLSLGTLVVEATFRSGTSITAKYALNQERKLYCIPNCIGNKNSCGTINLLKQGAKLVTKPDEILADIGTLNNKVKVDKCRLELEKNSNEKVKRLKLNLKGYDEFTKKIICIINQNTGITPDGICQISKIAIQKINSILISLEIEGIIENYNGNKYKIVEEICV